MKKWYPFLTVSSLLFTTICHAHEEFVDVGDSTHSKFSYLDDTYQRQVEEKVRKAQAIEEEKQRKQQEKQKQKKLCEVESYKYNTLRKLYKSDVKFYNEVLKRVKELYDPMFKKKSQEEVKCGFIKPFFILVSYIEFIS